MLSDLTLREIELFVLAARTRSLREVSRKSGLLPANVSKIMQKLEVKLNKKLFQRTNTGVSLSPEGLSLLDPALKILELYEKLESPSLSSCPHENLWTLGSISFVSTYLLAPQVAAWHKKLSHTRFRLIEFTHNDLVAHGLKGAFELAIHTEKLEWTRAWETTLIGKLHWKLYGRTGHPLGGRCREPEVLDFPFIVPTDWGSNGYESGEDFCPLSVNDRKKGDEASTAETALNLCRYSDQLTFVPEILARPWCERREIQEIQVEGWPPIDKQIFLSVKADVVPKKLLDVILLTLKRLK